MTTVRPVELGRLDAVSLLIAAIVVLDALGAVARGGAQTLTWLAVVAALFFMPAGLVVAELGAAFPNQGGPAPRRLLRPRERVPAAGASDPTLETLLVVRP